MPLYRPSLNAAYEVIIDNQAGELSLTNCSNSVASMVMESYDPSLSLQPESAMVFRERTIDVRYPSAAETYTAPPRPLGAVHILNEHPFPNVSEDPLPSVALRAAPFPSFNDTLSTWSDVIEREVPDAAVMSE